MAKTNRPVIVSVRLDEETIKDLDKEAKARGLDRAAYIRMLVFTHQDRQKKKS